MQRRFRSTLIVLVGALGFVVLFALQAAADIPGIRVAAPEKTQEKMYLPTRPEPAESEEQAPAEQPVAAEAPPAVPAVSTTEMPPVATKPASPRATPATEHVVTRSLRPTRLAAANQESNDNGPSGPIERVLGAVNDGFRSVGEFLGEVVSACKVGATTGSGGPALVFAVLGMATVFERRWVRGARWITREDVPELLYAGDVIAPG